MSGPLDYRKRKRKGECPQRDQKAPLELTPPLVVTSNQTIPERPLSDCVHLVDRQLHLVFFPVWGSRPARTPVFSLQGNSLSPQLVLGPGFIASRLHHRELRRAGERHRSQHIMGSDRYGVAHALSSRRPPRWTCSSAVWAAASNCYTTLPSSPATAFERGLIAIGTEPRAPRTSHLPSSAPS